MFYFGSLSTIGFDSLGHYLRAGLVTTTTCSNYDANGRYARVQPMFLPSTFSGGTLTANQPSQKLNGFVTGNLTRCPGGTVQPAPDGSNPVAAGSCNPASTPPGP